MADWQAEARQAAEKYGIDPNIFIRQINQESGGRDVTSGAGAQGPAQFIPSTARSYGLNSTTVHQLGPSLDAAARYMRDNLKTYGTYQRALSAYNSGKPDAYKDPNFAGGQTYNYVRTILNGKNPPPVSGSASSPRPSGNTPSAGGVSSTAPSAPDAGGQASDLVGLLSSLLGQQQKPQAISAPLAPPAFAASALTPQGFQPIMPAVAQPSQAQDPLSGDLSLVAALQGPDGTASTPGGSTAAQAAPGGSGGGIAANVHAQRAAGIRISPHARPGDPVVSSTQSVGGQHETEGLAGYPAHDYFAPAGTHAVAPVSGTIVKLSGHDPAVGPTEGPHGPFGYSVYIKGEDGKTYYLTHMGARTVKVGQSVKQGQVIGTVGDYDKYGTPSHIHQGVSGG